MKRLAAFLPITLLLLTAHLAAQGNRYIPITIPTRDGKSLAADLYASDTTRRKPTILVQTPYNKNFYRLAINIPPEAGGSPFPYDSAHYNYVVLDWRGFFGSKDAGAGAPTYDRGLDGYDAVEWIAAQSWSDGKVGTWGPSALGQIQFLTARRHPPHLVCCVPLVKDFKTKYSDYYYGGVFRKEHVESLQSLGFLSTSIILAHQAYNLTWMSVERNNDYVDSLDLPMLLITGWYDHYPDDIIRAWYDLRERSAPAVRSAHKLMVGPWIHGAIGKAKQGLLSYPNAAGASDSAALRFFDYYLRGIDNGYPSDPPIRYYQMGSDEWRSTSDWHGVVRSADTLSLYLAPGLQLLRTKPSTPGVDTIIFDPRDPSPTHGGSRLAPFGEPVTEGPQDLRDVVEDRGDVLLFSTPPLEEDLEVTGGVTVELTISSNRLDTDFGVRLCDVYPDGRSIILTQGIKRARFRDGLRPQDTSLLTPGTPARVTVELQNIAMTFLKGHRLRIDITSSNYPQYELNLNNGGAMYTAGDTLVATNLVHHGGAAISRVAMPVAKIGSVQRGDRIGDAIMMEEITPNPSSGAASIAFSLPSTMHATVKIYDLLGREVGTLFDGIAQRGRQVVSVDAGSLPAGSYVVSLQAGGIVRGRRIVLTK